MIPFIVLLIIPIITQHAYVKGIDYQKKNKFALLFFFLLLTALVALRHKTVGNDTQNYINLFSAYSLVDWSDILSLSSETGFALFNKLVSVFTDEPQVFFAITAIITMAMIYHTYKRLCVDPSLTIVLFCIMSTFVMAFSGIRQMLAIGIGFIAYEFTRNKKLIPFIIAVIVAISFHTSAFMLAFMYPLYHAKITKKWLYAVVPAMIAVFVFNERIFYLLSFYIEQYTEYEGGITQTGAYAMIVLFVLFAVFAFLIPDESRLDEEIIGLRNLLLFAIVMQMFAPLHMIAMRMNYYYIIFIPLLIPKIIEYRSERWKQVAIVGRHVMVVFFFVYSFISLSSGVLHVYPYHFFWENVL